MTIEAAPEGELSLGLCCATWLSNSTSSGEKAWAATRPMFSVPSTRS